MIFSLSRNFRKALGKKMVKHYFSIFKTKVWQQKDISMPDCAFEKKPPEVFSSMNEF